MGKTGHKIWYGIAMFLSGLILVISLAGIVGVWITERAVSTTVIQVLESVSDVTGGLRLSAKGVDQKLMDMQAVTEDISAASEKLSQNVSDRGLIPVLLPAEKEQNLANMAASVRETVGNIREMLLAALTLYRSIDRLPFVDLPAPTQEQIEKIGGLAGEIQSAVDTLEASIAAFRAGASDQIGRVQAGAQAVSALLGDFRDRLADLDSRLAVVQEALDRLGQMVATALVVAASLFTLFLGWVAYSQVELMRVYGNRWKAAGTEPGIEATSGAAAGAASDNAAAAGELASENPAADGTAG